MRSGSRKARASPTSTRWGRSRWTRSARSPSARCPTSTPTTSTPPRRSSPAPPARWASTSSRRLFMAHGKRYRKQLDKVQRDQAYPPAEAIALLKETASAKFDETVELHVLLGVNVRHAEEQLRGTLALPHGLGKDVSVAVFAQGQQARDAEAAGADFVGGDDLAKKVEEGWTDFDVVIATPQMMGTVGKLGRVLGPQGKMPN